MAYELNRAAFDHAADLIWDDEYRLNVNWREAQPTAAAEDDFIAAHGLDEYAKWYLIIDTDAPTGSKDRYHFPVGNFRTVAREGVLAARAHAARHDLPDIHDAAEVLLGFFDRKNAC